MLAISSSAQVMRASFQEPTVSRLRLAAERAQQVADTLQLQAREAWQEAVRADTHARGLDGRATQAMANAGQAQDQFLSYSARVAAAPAAPLAARTDRGTDVGTEVGTAAAATRPIPVWSATPSPASVNNLGQRVGMSLNITA